MRGVCQDGLCRRCGEQALTRNSKLAAEGVIMVTSWAVEALCMALGPMEAKETLPTRTLYATVRD